MDKFEEIEFEKPKSYFYLDEVVIKNSVFEHYIFKYQLDGLVGKLACTGYHRDIIHRWIDEDTPVSIVHRLVGDIAYRC